MNTREEAMKISAARVHHLLYGGVPQGEGVEVYEKHFAQMRGLYKNPAGMADDALAYTVYSYKADRAETPGELLWGLTVLEPLYVNGECNMTRGHFHQDLQCAEFYFGVDGEGLLLLMDSTGKTWAEEVRRGSLHHIDGTLAHRLVNTGDVPLQVGACWPSAAGHDYGTIEKQEFGYRVFRRDGNIESEER